MNFIEINMLVLSLLINNFNGKPVRLKVERYGSKIDKKFKSLCLFDKITDYDIRDNEKIKAIVSALCANEAFETKVYDLTDCIAIIFERRSYKERASQYAEYTLFVRK